ncbi:MAG: cupin domain-containing protein [bacterium]
MLNRLALISLVSLAFIGVFLGAAVAQSGFTIALLGTAEMVSPSSPVNIRVSQGLFAADAPPITHSHAAGWVYVVQGTHILTVGGRTETVQPGQAVWTPAGVAHTHDWSRSEAHKFWFIGTATNQPPTVPPGFRLFSLTDPLEGLFASRYTVRLARVSITVGAQTDVRKAVDPELLVGETGTAVVMTGSGATILNAEQVLLLQAGSAYQIRNRTSVDVSVLVQSLSPRE